MNGTADGVRPIVPGSSTVCGGTVKWARTRARARARRANRHNQAKQPSKNLGYSGNKANTVWSEMGSKYTGKLVRDLPKPRTSERHNEHSITGRTSRLFFDVRGNTDDDDDDDEMSWAMGLVFIDGPTLIRVGTGLCVVTA
jgi:hypothetical protein